MLNTLFSPSGRLGPSEFLKGLFVVALISALIAIVPMFSFSLGQTLGYASILLLFPLFCLIIKRCHDAGKSGWMSILFFLLIAIVGGILQYFIGNMFAGTAMEEMKAASQELAQNGGSLSEIMEGSKALAEQYGPAIAKSTALPGAVAGLAGTMIGGWLTNMLLKSNLHDNKYGPAT